MSLQKQFIKAKKKWKVTFSLPVEAVNEGKKVMVLGDFNEWDAKHAIAMQKKDNCFTATTELEPGKDYEFRYLIDNEKWTNDNEADRYIPTPYGVENSVLVLPRELEN